MCVEESKWQTLNKDKKGFMDSIKCVIRNTLSDNNNISETANSTVNPDRLPGSNESENGKMQVVDYVNDENISLQMHSQGHNKNEKMSVDEKEPISSKEEDNAVAGPSGICPHKKKFPKISGRKDTLKTNYRTGTGDKPFICNVCKKEFSRKVYRDRHYLTHTGERPFGCDFCEKRFAHAQGTEVQGKENTSFTASSENIESAHRPEIVHREAYEETTVSAGSSGFQIQNQSASGVSDLLYATTDEEYKTSLENSKWQTLNYDKKKFIDSLECVVKTGHSESKSISGNENLILKNVSECLNHKNISPEMHSQGQNNKKKWSTDLKEPISTKEDDNAVAGPSGFCSGKKKFPKNSCKKDTPKTNYRTRTSEKRDICKKQFSQKSGLNLHYITHTGKTPYACDVRKKSKSIICSSGVEESPNVEEKKPKEKIDICGLARDYEFPGTPTERKSSGPHQASNPILGPSSKDMNC
ncbi:Zinc finger protein 182 like protein [Argiope bruennichi]|uniref:Zinc finger protein 182 like protein n=1 Tax=Argiope bruennichi TaxID=94029 RepID=A0A8T0FBB9_ARGBR|nr:Zinc finger protein 182 like protein [Argiope bruennichi]